MYELIQEPDGDFSEAHVNTVEITEVPNSDSEEPQYTDSTDSIDPNILMLGAPL
jgi:hypothetical protein